MGDNDKYIAIGDIHGCAATLEKMLQKLSPYFDRRFVFVGDYIDRGPKSRQVVDRLLYFQTKVDCTFLRGNHEQMLLDALHKNDFELWVRNGGRNTLQSYGMPTDGYCELNFSEAHQDFYEQTELYFDTENYFFVHAGISPVKTIAECLDDEMERKEFLWERSHLNAFKTSWEKTVVFGHTPRPRPLRKEHMIGIDTGCVYERLGYGKLTAAVLPEEEFIQQICIDQ